MPNLDPISRLNAALEGRYRIERQLGEGGMATVYLADDLRHERKVALKVLKPELAAVVGAERFLAEIKTTASLQHPHILPLFDSGEADSFLFYVMPYVEGESLRERLDREHQLPVDEAVSIASKVAGALQAAHERGVIHRDIKPANILLSKGEPLVSDFGIALAVSAGGAGRLTETGLSLGTPHYMSPEQATGDLSVGAATDIYALGCVLYEMLVGEPPYTGSTPQAVLGKIVTGDADPVTKHRRSVPPNVEAAIRRALEKVPADRFPNARDFAKTLADPDFRHGSESAAAVSARPWRGVAIAASLVALVSVVVASVAVSSASDESTRPAVRFTVPIGEGDEVFLGGERDAGFLHPGATSLALSPDGTLLVYAAWNQNPGGNGIASRLYARRLGEERSRVIAETEGGASPFFSPDGEWIAFFVGGALKRVRVSGGSPETILADAEMSQERPRGAAWGDDGSIIYGGIDGLYRVPSSGGRIEVAVAETEDVFLLTQPHFLPGSEVVLFTGWHSRNPVETEVFAQDLGTGERTSLLVDAMDAQYVASGHLLFMRQGTLMAVGFDPERVEISGEPFIVQESVNQAVGMPNTDVETGASQVAVSAAGHLAYAAGGVFRSDPLEFVRLRPDGSEETLNVRPGAYSQVRVSPDGGSLAFMVSAGRAHTISVHDLARGVTEPLNIGGFSSSGPTWSPDGRSIAFDSDRDGDNALYVMPADGTGEPERLGRPTPINVVYSWSTEGVVSFDSGDDIWVVPPDGEPVPFFESDADEQHATFSPDGHWLAYDSDQTGRSEVYVRPYPGPDPATRISVNLGINPVWSPDGRRIHFLTPREDRSGGMMMSARVATDPDFRVEGVDTLFAVWAYPVTSPNGSIGVFPDGSLITPRYTESAEERAGGHRVTEIHLVLNFLEELRERAGAS